MSVGYIACEMLRDELELAMSRTGIHPAVIWVDKGLHDKPEKLRAVLQEKIDSLRDCETVCLAMANCGGAVNGLFSRTSALAVPRFDDCVRMLLSVQPGVHNAADPRTLYYTRQWMDSLGHITREYDRYVARYGEEEALELMQLMLANYRRYCMIQTGAYDLTAWESQARQDAARLKLEYATQPGSVRVLEKLLRQQFDEEFCVVLPGEPLTQLMFLRMDA